MQTLHTCYINESQDCIELKLPTSLREQPHLLERGIVTLGGVAKDGTDWQQGQEVVPMTIDDLTVRVQSKTRRP